MMTIREDLRTVQLVPITPFDDQGKLNQAIMQTLAERMVDAGIKVFIPCAGSAEFHSLLDSEILESIRTYSEVVGQRGKIMAPIGLALDWAISLGQRAVDAGADCLLVMPLNFPYLSDEGARDYYLRLLDRAQAPVLIYKKGPIPSDRLLLELAEHPQLIGVKYAVNDLDALNRVIHQDDGRIDWYCGSAERFSPFFGLAGSPGYTSGAGVLCPRLTLAMHDAMCHANWDKVMELQRQILPIEHFRARNDNSFNISFLKHAITHTGLDFGVPRPPQRKLTLEEKREIDAIMPVILQAEQDCAAGVS